MLLQTNPDLLNDIQEFGCFYMDCLAIPQLVVGKDFNAKEINDLWNTSINYGWLIPNGRYFVVNKPVSIINEAFDTLNVPNKTANNVAVRNSDGNNWVPNWFTGFDYMFQTNKSGNADGVHYRLFDSNSQVIYDSYPGLTLGDWQQRSYYLLGAR